MLSQTSGGSGEKTKIVFSTKAVENETLHQIDNEAEHNGAFVLKNDGKQKRTMNSPDFVGPAKTADKGEASTTAAQASQTHGLSHAKLANSISQSQPKIQK